MENNPSKSLIDYSEDLSKKACRFSHNAMTTVFGIFIFHDDSDYAEKCAFHAFNELDRLENELSRFIESSDISRINNSVVDQPVKVGIETFECIENCMRLNKDTGGAFDITAGQLINYWKNENHSRPSDVELNEVFKLTGALYIHLDKNQFTVSIKSKLICLDLGGVGKGYALDRMAEVLYDYDVNSAMIHGGKSSVLALQPPPGEKGWQITLRNPSDPDQIVSNLFLKNQAISGSGIQKGEHIIDPRTGHPVSAQKAAWALCSNAADSDALSTAFMVMSQDEIKNFCVNNEDVRAIKILDYENEEKVFKCGS